MKGKRGWVLLTGCVTLLMAGVIYAWSVLKTPVKAEFGWTDTQTQLCFTLTLCFFCLGGLLSGLISRRVTLRVRLLAAAVLVIGGFDLSAHAEGRLGLFYLGYGVLTALGVGVVYNAVIACVNGWFADKKGMASGAMMMSFGFSALLMSRAFQALLGGMGWKEIYMLLGTVIGLVIAVSAFVLKNPPAAQTAAGTEKDVSTREMLKTGSFWKLFAFFTLLAAVGSSAIGFGRDYFRSVGMAENAAVTLAGLLAVFNGLGRLFSGWLCDRAGLSRTRMVTSAVAIVAPALALLACGVMLGIFIMQTRTAGTISVQRAAPDEPEEAVQTVMEEPSDAADDRLDLNTATAAELQELPGIGEVIAQRIIDYRDLCGHFLDPEQLMEVDGIGEAKYEKLRDLVTVRNTE